VVIDFQDQLLVVNLIMKENVCLFGALVTFIIWFFFLKRF